MFSLDETSVTFVTLLRNNWWGFALKSCHWWKMWNVDSSFKINLGIRIHDGTENSMPSMSTPLFLFQVNEENELCLAVAAVLSDVSLSSSEWLQLRRSSLSPLKGRSATLLVLGLQQAHPPSGRRRTFFQGRCGNECYLQSLFPSSSKIKDDIWTLQKIQYHSRVGLITNIWYTPSHSTKRILVKIEWKNLPSDTNEDESIM